jgi:hypothetical protein
MNEEQFILLIKTVSRAATSITFTLFGVMIAVLYHMFSANMAGTNLFMVAATILVFGIFQTLQYLASEKLISNYINKRSDAKS